MRALLVAVLAVLLVELGACGPSSHYPLDPKFSPLREVVQVPSIRPGVVSTVYAESWTRSIQDLLDSYAPGSVEWDALFFHERVHSVREFDNRAYLDQYAVDAGFRWQEEQLGYATEIRYRLEHGVAINPAWYASVLSSNYQGMVSYQVALAWVDGVAASVSWP